MLKYLYLSKRRSSRPMSSDNSTDIAQGRFVYLVEDKFSLHLESDDSAVVTGTVHGTVHVNDEVYVIDYTGKTLLTRIRQLESMNGNGTEHPDSCTDAQVAITLGIAPSEIDRFCVVTNIRPWISHDVNQAVENPYLLGMIYGEKFREDDLYFSRLVYALSHAFFLTPVSMSKRPVSNGDGTATFEEETQISFSLLANPAFHGQNTLAVFTDWIELGKWQNAPKDGNGKVQTMILRFPDVVHLVVDPGINGCVVNAFGNSCLFIPTSLIDQITSLDGYRKENGDSPKTDNQGS